GARRRPVLSRAPIRRGTASLASRATRSSTRRRSSLLIGLLLSHALLERGPERGVAAPSQLAPGPGLHRRQSPARFGHVVPPLRGEPDQLGPSVFRVGDAADVPP